VWNRQADVAVVNTVENSGTRHVTVQHGDAVTHITYTVLLKTGDIKPCAVNHSINMGMCLSRSGLTQLEEMHWNCHALNSMLLLLLLLMMNN